MCEPSALRHAYGEHAGARSTSEHAREQFNTCDLTQEKIISMMVKNKTRQFSLHTRPSSRYQTACDATSITFYGAVMRVVLVTHVLSSALSGTSMVGTPVPQVQVNMLASSLMRAI